MITMFKNRMNGMLYKIGYPQSVIEKQKDSHLIIAYHGIVDNIRNPVIDKWAITANELSKHIDIFQECFEIVSLDRLLEVIRNNETLRKPCLVITFDDGLENVYLNAYPLLRKRNIPFLVAFPSGLTGTSRTIWTIEIDIITQLSSLTEVTIPNVDRREGIVLPLKNAEQRVNASMEIRRAAMPEGGEYCRRIVDSLIEQCGEDNYRKLTDEYPYFKMMSIPQAREMVSNGVEPAVHGKLHLPINTIDERTLDNEIVGSYKELSEKLGKNDIKHFCLCHGAYSAKAMELIKQTGYKTCLTSAEPGRVKYGDDLYKLKRIEGNTNIADLVWSLTKQ